MFPLTRHRRNRKASWIRDLVAETTLLASDLIWPVFVLEGQKLEVSVKTLPGISRYSIDVLLKKVEQAQKLGIKAMALFPVVDSSLKNLDAKESYNPENLICRTIKAVKREFPDIGVICDVALDPYTSHGHDGLLNQDTGLVENDTTVDILIRQSLVQVEAGCDIIAPSDMMDGRIIGIREALESNKFTNVNILAYSAKYSSSFYGPFRDAVGSAQNLGNSDKKNYQMDFRNQIEALQEIQSDIDEGADMVMIKPGMPYLDIVSMAKNNFNVPIFIYQVSGEYAMLKFAAQNGCFNFDQVLIESLTAMKRAGASAILTYGALEAATILGQI